MHAQLINSLFTGCWALEIAQINLHEVMLMVSRFKTGQPIIKLVNQF